jgi:hypothetical protein
MPNNMDLSNLCEHDAEYARVASDIWAHDLPWQGINSLCLRREDGDIARLRMGHEWVLRGAKHMFYSDLV